MGLYLGIDLGTSAFKLGLFDGEGRLQGLGRVPVVTNRGEGGSNGSELPVDSFWSNLRKGLAQALEEANAQAKDIQSVSYAAQANTFILLDEHDRPLTPFILWPDRRAVKYYPEIRSYWSRKSFLPTVGFNMHSPEFAVAKLRWFQEERPSLWKQVRQFQTVSDYLVYGLTGESVGDQGTASLLGLWDQTKSRWWPEALDTFGLREDFLSTLLRPGSFAGNITSQGSECLPLPVGIPLFVGSLDHHVAGLSTGLEAKTEISLSLGTVIAALTYEENYIPAPDMVFGPHFVKNQFFKLSFNNFGASWLERYKNAHAADMTWEQFLGEAAEVESETGGLEVDTRASLSANKLLFKGVFPSHDIACRARAVMDAICREMRRLMTQHFPDRQPEAASVTGGGARNPHWLQLMANLLEVKVVTTASTENGCLGAAILARAGKLEEKNLLDIAMNMTRDDITCTLSQG